MSNSSTNKMKSITITDFIHNNYRAYWIYANSHGKNSVDPREQIPEVVRRIIYSAYKLGIKPSDEVKTTSLQGEVIKIHPHGDSSIQDSIKGVATAYKSQPATRLLTGIGNFGSIPGDDGAAARYTAVGGTPLLSKIYEDIPFIDYSEQEGEIQPDFISSPIPLGLINGIASIGTGKSCYLAEREAVEIIDWIKEMYETDDWESIDPPAEMSQTSCETWYNSDNGYVYYEAVVHHKVDANDLEKSGKFDVITALPPKSTPQNVIYKLQQKLPTRATKNIVDGTGRGRGVWIVVPTGFLDEKDYTKYGMRTARKEQIIIWDTDRNVPYVGDIHNIAKKWFESRCNVVTKRLQSQIESLQERIHKINLIKIYAENNMQSWKIEDIIKYYIEKVDGGDEEKGKKDAEIVLSTAARAFLPENINKNEIEKEEDFKKIEELENSIKHIGDFILKEAYNIIEKQKKFFS